MSSVTCPNCEHDCVERRGASNFCWYCKFLFNSNHTMTMNNLLDPGSSEEAEEVLENIEVAFEQFINIVENDDKVLFDLWLKRAHVTKVLQDKYKILYIDAGRALTLSNGHIIKELEFCRKGVLACRNFQKTVVCAQLRGFDEGPKYLTVGDRDQCFMSESLRRCDPFDNLGYIVIVEDILSAIRVGEFAPTICPLGTGVTKVQLQQILDLPTTNFIIWFDGDVAGLKGREKLKRELGLVRTISFIDTEKDPKEYTDNEIVEILKTARV